MICRGDAADHCCHIAGAVCRHLEENTVPGRRWACGLYRVHGSWDAMYKSDEYGAVRAKLTQAGIEVDCGDWPPPGLKCATCGGCD